MHGVMQRSRRRRETGVMKPKSKPRSERDVAKVESSDQTSECNWKDRLILRRYHFPASGGSEHDLAVRIDYAGTGYYFPLGTPDAEAAAAKAARIYRMVENQGWNSVFQEFSRELI